MIAQLFTRAGELATECEIPEFQVMPEVLVWGTRIFCLREPFAQLKQPAEPKYYEVCTWWVSAAGLPLKGHPRRTSLKAEAM